MNAFFRTQRNRALIVAAALAVMVGSASANDVKVKLIGAEETPPVTSSATGTGTIVIAADKSVSGTIKTTGIDGTVDPRIAVIAGNDPLIRELSAGDFSNNVPNGAFGIVHLQAHVNFDQAGAADVIAER